MACSAASEDGKGPGWGSRTGEADLRQSSGRAACLIVAQEENRNRCLRSHGHCVRAFVLCCLERHCVEVPVEGGRLVGGESRSGCVRSPVVQARSTVFGRRRNRKGKPVIRGGYLGDIVSIFSKDLVVARTSRCRKDQGSHTAGSDHGRHRAQRAIFPGPRRAGSQDTAGPGGGRGAPAHALSVRTCKKAGNNNHFLKRKLKCRSTGPLSNI